MSNYDKMDEAARKIFLGMDQGSMIERHHLKTDGQYLYVPFLNGTVRIDRATAETQYSLPAFAAAQEIPSWHKASQVLSNSVFEALTYAPEKVTLSGKWAGIPELGGHIGAGHAGNGLQDSYFSLFSGKREALEHACSSLGGRREEAGSADVSFVFDYLPWFPLWLTFWDGDDEFPASGSFLFDASSLKIMRYEVLWYTMNVMIDLLKKKADEYGAPSLKISQDSS